MNEDNISRYDQYSLEFIDFIRNFLFKYSELNEHTINILTDHEGMYYFNRAFIHDSYNNNTDENYEAYEFYGDMLLNFIVSDIFMEKYPDITDPETLHKIKSYMSNKEMLSNIAEKKLKIEPFIKYKNILLDHKMKSIREDILEALVYAIYLLIKKKGYSSGVAYETVNTIVKSIFGDINIEFDKLVDDVTLLKELYDIYKWTEDGKLPSITTQLKNSLFKVEYYGFPLGDKTKKSENKYTFKAGLGKSKKEAEQEAAKNALVMLRDYYKIILPKKKILMK